MRWGSNVDLGAGEIRLEPGTTNNDEGRAFPISVLPRLAEVLTEQKRRTEAIEKSTRRMIPWVFHRQGHRIKDFRGAWDKAIEAAGIPRKIPHDFRRTAVRNLERAGVPSAIAMKRVGHKTESIYRRYAIVAKQDLVDGLKRLADHRAELETKPADREVSNITDVKK